MYNLHKNICQFTELKILLNTILQFLTDKYLTNKIITYNQKE